MTFEEAIQMGEYKPEFLAQYPEWKTFSRHVQLEYISKAMANRKTQLMKKWSEMINFMDQSEIPEMKKKMADNIFEKIRQLAEEKERIYFEYLGSEEED